MAKIGVGTKTGAFLEGLFGGIGQQLQRNQQKAEEQFLRQKDLEDKLALKAAETEQKRQQMLWEQKHGFLQSAEQKLADRFAEIDYPYGQGYDVGPQEAADIEMEKQIGVTRGKMPYGDERPAWIRGIATLEELGIDPSRMLTKEMIEQDGGAALNALLKEKGYSSPEEQAAMQFSTGLAGMPNADMKVYDPSARVAALGGEGYIPYWQEPAIREALAAKAEQDIIGATGIGEKDKGLLGVIGDYATGGQEMSPEFEEMFKKIYGVDLPQYDPAAKAAAIEQMKLVLGTVETAQQKRERDAKEKKAAADYKHGLSVELAGIKADLAVDVENKKSKGGKKKLSSSAINAEKRKIKQDVSTGKYTPKVGSQLIKDLGKGAYTEKDRKQLDDAWVNYNKRKDEDKGKGTRNYGGSTSGAPKLKR